MPQVSLPSVEIHRRAIVYSFSLVFCALYLPFAWLLQLDFTTNSYHFHWLCMWPVLPGLVAGIPFKGYYDDPGLFLASGFATAIILLGLTWVGVRFRLGLLFSIAVALIVSIPTSVLAYSAFRH